MRGLGYLSDPETKEAPGMLWGKWGFRLSGLGYRGGYIGINGKENGNHYNGVILGSYGGDIGEVGKKIETTII